MSNIDLTKAKRVRDFFHKFLRHSKGQWAGQPFKLLDWQWEGLVKPLYGTLNESGLRQYRTAYIEIPKKNGKSTLLSGLALYHLMSDGEQGAEVYCAAADKKQADIIFREALTMIKGSPFLMRQVRQRKLILQESIKRIEYTPTHSFFQCLSSEVFTKEGLNASCILFDELHAQSKRDLWDTLRYAGAARSQPLLISITTAGYNRETICYEQREYAEGVASGRITDPTFFGYIKSAPESADWTDPEVHKLANPSYGITITPESLIEACTEAQNDPRKESAFRRYRLNQWVGHAEQWLSSKLWADAASSFAEQDFYGAECYLGIDLSRKYDLSALAYLFERDGIYHVIPRFFLPADLAQEKTDKDKVPYRTWEKAGFVRFTAGDVIDQMEIRKVILEDSKKFKIKEIGFDPYNAEILCNHFLAQTDNFTTVVVAQTMGGIGSATAYLEQLIKESKLKHNNNPCLNWNAQNAVVDEDKNGKILISKGKSKTNRIDGIAAIINALSRAMVYEKEKGTIYNQRGLLEI